MATRHTIQSLCPEAAEFFCNSSSRFSSSGRLLTSSHFSLSSCACFFTTSQRSFASCKAPRPPLVGIEGLRLHEVFERVKVFLQIEDAIAHPEVEAFAVELRAIFQTIAEGLLGHAGVEDLAFEVVNGRVLRTNGRAGDQQERDAASNPVHVRVSKRRRMAACCHDSQSGEASQIRLICRWGRFRSRFIGEESAKQSRGAVARRASVRARRCCLVPAKSSLHNGGCGIAWGIQLAAQQQLRRGRVVACRLSWHGSSAGSSAADG